MNCELPDVQTGYRKGRGTRDQTANVHWIIEKAREFQKNIYFYFSDYTKAFDCVDHNKLWKILQETGIPDHFTCLLRNLYAQKVIVRAGHETMDWFQTGKGVHQGCILPLCLFNLYAEWRMWKWKSLRHVWLFVTPWTIQSMEFSRPEYWSGLPFPSPSYWYFSRQSRFQLVLHLTGHFTWCTLHKS